MRICRPSSSLTSGVRIFASYASPFFSSSFTVSNVTSLTAVDFSAANVRSGANASGTSRQANRVRVIASSSKGSFQMIGFQMIQHAARSLVDGRILGLDVENPSQLVNPGRVAQLQRAIERHQNPIGDLGIAA